MLGEELHRLGHHDQAVAAFRRSIAARPQETAPHGKLGVCLAETGDLEGAAKAFTAQRNLDPASPEASNGFAMLSFLRGDLSTAKKTYLETLALDANNLAARVGLLAIEEAPGGSPAEALRWCEDIRRLAPGGAGNDECIRRNQARLAGSGSGGS
jgi:Flp pilus assembly protein TadD